jgi:hypothetical protein
MWPKRLDVAVRPSGQARHLANDAAGIGELVGLMQALSSAAIVVEVTGSYEAPLVWRRLVLVCLQHVRNLRQLGHLRQRLSRNALRELLQIARIEQRERRERRLQLRRDRKRCLRPAVVVGPRDVLLHYSRLNSRGPRSCFPVTIQDEPEPLRKGTA